LLLIEIVTTVIGVIVTTCESCNLWSVLFSWT